MFQETTYPFEAYRNEPYANGSPIHEVDIYVPIEPMNYVK